MKRFVAIVLLCSAISAWGQNKSDHDLLAAHTNSNASFEQKRKVEYLFKNKNAFIKYNPVSLFFGGALFFYQSTVSTQIAAQCPYEYHCSHFSKLCIRKYGLLKGTFLTADRLTRCTRLAAIDISEYADIRNKTSKIIDDPEDYTFKGNKP